MMFIAIDTDIFVFFRYIFIFIEIPYQMYIGCQRPFGDVYLKITPLFR